MWKKMSNLLRARSLRNIAIVASGTAAAQAITVLFAPVITRLYGPEAFGVLGVFMAMISIVSPIAALTYPLAIVLPKSDNEARRLMRLSLYISCVFAILMMFTILLLGDYLITIFKIEMVQQYIILLPLIIISSAYLQVVQQWLIRTKQFRTTAKITFYQSVILNSSKVGIGWVYPAASMLILIAVFGIGLHAIMLSIGTFRLKQGNISQSFTISYKELMKKYRDFPIFRAPQVLLNSFSQGLPVMMLTAFFGPVSVGFYSIAKTLLVMPTALIGKSVSDVFYPRIAELKNSGGNLSQLVLKATLTLAAIGLVPYGAIIILGPEFFVIFFGEKWGVAGIYAQWMAIWLYFMFISRACIVAIPVLDLQKGFLFYEVFGIGFKVISLIVGFYVFENDVVAVALYSIIGVLAYIFLILWVFYSSVKKQDQYI